MNNHLVWAIIALVIGSLIQVGVVPLPIGIFVIFGWFLFKGTKHLVLLVLLYSLLLGAFSNLPIYVVLLASCLALIPFMIGKGYLPSRNSITLALFAVGFLVWEGSIYIILNFGI